MAVAMTCRKSRALPGQERTFPGIRHEHEFAFEQVDQLVLVRMPVAHGRGGARPERRQVDADLREAGRIAERALFARQDLLRELLGIAGTGMGLKLPG